MVGPSGLEPPTSCLSGTRSNLLSYEPMWLVSDPNHLFLGGDDGIRFSHSLRIRLVNNELSTAFVNGGDDGIRTHDPLLAGQVLSQLSYTPR